jgi:arylsulfatase A-like enzyme
MKRKILYLLIFGVIAGILVSLIEILFDQFNGSLDLPTIFQIYLVNIATALLANIALGITAFFLLKIFLSAEKIAEKRTAIFSLAIPLMISLFIPKFFIDYLALTDLGKISLYFGCFLLLFVFHFLIFKKVVNFFLHRKWRWIAISLLGFIFVVLSILSADKFTTKDQLLNYENVKAKISTSDPNIIFLVIDALRPDALPCYGNKIVQTPTIERIATNGVVFKEAYTALPKTLPSLCSFLTGLYPRTHGVLEMGIPLRENQATLAEILKLKGYVTAAFIANYVLSEQISGLHQGFDYYFAGFPLKKEAVSISGSFNPLVEKRADTLTESMLYWLENNSANKFFIWAHYMDPHAAYDPPPPYNKMYSDLKKVLPNFKIRPELIHYQAKIKGEEDFLYYLSQYYGEVSFCDEQIGRLLNFLLDKDLYDNTLIIVTADHGESFGEHKRFFSHGHNLNQENIRIPFILSLPAVIEGGIEIDSPVMSIDMMPTILHLMKIEPASYIQGESLLPLIKGDKKKRDNPILIQAYGGAGWSIIKNNWKLIYLIKGRSYQLFELSKDPNEQDDLRQKNIPKMAQLRKLLKTRINSFPNNTIIKSSRLKQLKNSIVLRIWGKKKVPIDQREDLSPEVKQRLKALGYIQ